MDTLNSKVLDMLKKQCSYAANARTYMKHIIIDLDNSNTDTKNDKIKENIIELVKQNFPVREDILPFTLNKNGENELEFKIQKTTF